jgi:FkbM family methyltransferase
MKSQSQYGQDSLIGDVLFRGRSGVFVDVGARDGKQISNTIYLEQEKGWTGVAIEPHPDLFDRLIKTRTCKCINVAASDAEHSEIEFVKFLEEPLGNSGLLSTFRSPARLQNIRHQIISVPCQPLSKIIGGIDLIHYLDIDVEGHELAVLKGIDFSQTEIRIIGIEVHEGMPDFPAIDSLLKANGFRPFLQLVSDRFYHHGDGVPSVQQLSGMP